MTIAICWICDMLFEMPMALASKASQASQEQFIDLMGYGWHAEQYIDIESCRHS